MDGRQDEWQQRRYGQQTIGENLRDALARGALTADADGTWRLTDEGGARHYLQVQAPRYLGCDYLNHFLFDKVYARTAVPYGCRHCYKLKIVPRTLRELVALRDILETLAYQSKCGVDFYNPHSQDFYAGFLYLEGLDEARAAYGHLRGLIDADARLGPAVGLRIKRGCTNYEVACGPADRYEFPAELAEIEALLRPRFRSGAATAHGAAYRIRRAEAMIGWIDFAYRIKDDTYLEFTGGRPWYPPAVSFPPE